MKKLLWKCLLTAVFGLLLSTSALAAGLDDLSYIVKDDGTIEITDCVYSASGDLTIPSIIDGRMVTSIGYQAFYECSSLTSVTIPSTVTSIGVRGFYRCSKLSNITIPSSVTEIGYDAFSGYALHNAGPIGGNYDMQFGWKDKIPAHAFEECFELTEISIPDSVTEIGDSAFADCDSLTHIVIPDRVDTIGNGAFLSCSSLTEITLPKNLDSLGAYVFEYCSAMSEINIPDSVTTIGSMAFYECDALVRIDLPDHMTTVADHMFVGCSSLETVEFPTHLTKVGENVFRKCTSLKDIAIPSSVTEIGSTAFAECSSLTEITIPDGVSAIKNETFDGCSNLTNVTLPLNLTSIGTAAFRNCNKLDCVVLPDSLTMIGNFAFDNCESLTSVSIPCGIETIWPYTFRNCKSLGDIFIPDSVTVIGAEAFYGCNSLADIYYQGTEDDWYHIGFSDNGSYFSSATVHYNYKRPGKDATIIQIPFSKYLFHVVDENGKALPNVQMTYDDQSGTTDTDGMVSFDSFTAGTPKVTAKLAGYTSWSNENRNWSKSDSRYETIVLYPVAQGDYKLFDCRYAKKADMSYSTDLLKRVKTLNVKNTGNLIGDLTDGSFYITCQAVKTDGVVQYELWQGEKKIAECTDGVFEKLSVDQFSKGGGCAVKVITAGGNAVKTDINLQFEENKINSASTIKLMNKISVEVNDDIPFLGGGKLELDFDALPVDIQFGETSFYVGFNTKLVDSSGLKNDPYEDLKKTMEAVKKANGLPLDKKTADTLKSMVKEDKDFTLPGGKFKVTVIGYAQADWGSSEAKGELYLLMEGQTKTFGFNTVVWVVPVTVQIKGAAKVQIGGEISYDWSINQMDGGLKLDVTVGMEAFGGIGAGDVAGVGAYGKADVNVAGQLLGTRQGVEKVDLTGELGIKAYVGWLTYERAFAHNTWHIYTRNNVGTLSLYGDTELPGLYDAGAYQVESLDYLREESSWLGDSISLMSADANTTLMPLLVGTYRNAQPVMLRAGNFLYAAFLRGDAESGHVSVWVTRFDGTSWAESVQADSGAILDDAPTLCADGSGNVWLAYARTAVEPGDSLLTYAQNQSIVVGKIELDSNTDTLKFSEKGEYSGDGYAHLQQLTVVGGQPVLVWADSEVTNEDSVLFPQSSCIYTAAYTDGTWGEAGMAVQVDKPIWQLTAGEQDGALTLAYIQDMDGDPDTDTDHDLYQLTGETTRKLAQGVQGNVTFGTLPGQSAAGFIWNAEDTLCSENGSVTVPGITGEYAVVGDNLYYSTATGGSADLAVMQYQDGQWGEPIQLTDGNRYLENLSAARLNGRDYVLGMHTRADIWDTVEINKNLVWAVVQPVSDLRLESASYDVETAAAGEEIPVTLSVHNAGDHEVSGIDILCGEALLKSVSCALRPGESTEVTISMTCPEVCMEYTFTVVETDEEDFTPDDNSRTLGMGYADVSVELSYEQVGTSQTLVAVLTNQGVEKASGTLFFTDPDGNKIGFTTFEGLAAGDAVLSILPLEEDFGGTVSVLAELDQEELYTYNNTARQAVIRMTEPTVIRSVKTSGTRVVAQLVSAEETACTAYCAVYDAYGKLLEITSSVVSPGEHTLDFTASVPFASAEVFLLNADSVPLCESVQG